MNTEKQKELLLTGFEITSDENFIQSLFPIPEIVQDQLQELHNLAQKGKKSSLRKFLKLVEKYPKIPTLKNYLSVLYQKMGNSEKANEVNHWIIAEHPNYLYGKINLAAEYWYNQQHEKMPEILGEAMDLKTLFPERDTFHVDEVVAFFSTTIYYFAEIGDLEQAEIRFDIIKEIYPESPKLEMVENVIGTARIRAASIRMEEDLKNRISIEQKPTKSGNKTEIPEFVNPEIKWIYENDFDIDLDDLKKIIELSRKSLIADLRIVLNDSIDRYKYFENIAVDTGWDNNTMNFLMHAFFIIGEIKATEMLDDVLHILSEDEDFISFYLEDIITEDVWEIIYKIANNELESLKQFMCKPAIYTYSKSAIVAAVEQILLHQPERKQEVSDWFGDILRFYNNCKIEDNIIDSELLGLITSSIIDLKFTELLPVTEELYKKKYVSIGMCGSFSDVKDEINRIKNFDDKREIKNIFEQYTDFTTWIENEDSENDDFFFNEDEDDDTYYTKPVKAEPKPGRNAPCPCGSGKKYKKCCMNK